MLFFRKMRVHGRPGVSVASKSIDRLINKRAEAYGKSLCLDVGCGEHKQPNYQTVDIRAENQPTYHGDIRCLFAPSPHFKQQLGDFPDLLKIPEEHFMLVKLQHVVEHIEWIYQLPLFRWVLGLLCERGSVMVATPNLEYAAKLYLKGLKRQRRGQRAVFPRTEHDYFKREDNEWDLQRWFNLKAFSGCSPGDYHHAMYDRFWLVNVMEQAGFVDVAVHNGSTLRVVGHKQTIDLASSVDDLVDGDIAKLKEVEA